MSETFLSKSKYVLYDIWVEECPSNRGRYSTAMRSVVQIPLKENKFYEERAYKNIFAGDQQVEKRNKTSFSFKELSFTHHLVK